MTRSRPKNFSYPHREEHDVTTTQSDHNDCCYYNHDSGCHECHAGILTHSAGHAGHGGLQGTIATRAYALYEERGYRHGCDLQDWLDAEREIVSRKPSSQA